MIQKLLTNILFQIQFLIQFIQMKSSHIVNEDQMYVKFNQQGNTQLITAKQIQPGFNYRRVHYTHEGQWRNNKKGNQVFLDPQYQIDKNQLSKLDNKNPRVVLKRLYDLYRYTSKTQKPQFFPSKNLNVNRIKNHIDLPPFVTEIGIFPVQHYKTLFLTQDFASDGLYQIIINQNGRFETDVVDDWIPVYEQSLQPIWQMDLDQAWQIILLKFWAKKNRSYYRIKQIPPFRFIQFFTNSNWKYYNLNKQGPQFLTYYTGKAKNGKFVLKTKNTDQVYKSGLIPNSAGYEIIDLKQQTGKTKFNEQKYSILIRSTLINKWSGDMSVLDKQINTKYEPNNYKMALQRDFMMNHNDFLNLFSAAYISSRRQKNNYFSDYYLLQIPPNNKNSIYLKFKIENDGWFDFCVKQFDEVKLPFTHSNSYTNNSTSNLSDGKRYLKVKFILVKDNSVEGSHQIQPDYNAPPYDVYQIEYLQGYNRGDARFQNIVKGVYILRIKIEKISQSCQFVVNYASNSKITMEEVQLSKKETSSILRSAMASMIGQLTSYSLDVTKKYEEIVFANLFDEVGYGFVGVRMKKQCPYRILIQIDPSLVKGSGYKLKNQFKKMTQPFSIIVSRGQSTTVVLNKVNQNASWPPQGIQIFRQKSS